MQEREENKHLEQLNKGNLDSFKWLYSHYYKQVYYYCLSLSKSPMDSEEITSDVFVKIWHKRASINASMSLKPLLFKITKDLTWNYLKRIAGKKELREKFIRENATALSSNGEDHIIFRENLDIFDQALRSLSPQQEKVFSFRYLEGKDLNQIAVELNISKNTVRVHLTNAKRLVLDYFKVHSV